MAATIYHWKYMCSSVSYHLYLITNVITDFLIYACTQTHLYMYTHTHVYLCMHTCIFAYVKKYAWKYPLKSPLQVRLTCTEIFSHYRLGYLSYLKLHIYTFSSTIKNGSWNNCSLVGLKLGEVWNYDYFRPTKGQGWNLWFVNTTEQLKAALKIWHISCFLL